MILLVWMLGRLLPDSNLVVVSSTGVEHIIGAAKGQPLRVRFQSRWLPWRLVFNPPLAMGEAYVRGDLIVEQGSLPHLLDLVTAATRRRRRSTFARVFTAFGRFRQRSRKRNAPSRAAAAIALHYDLPHALFDLILDADHTQYSCAFYAAADETLDVAQARKIARVLAKSRLQDGHRVLEIGCGWGGLSRAMAQLFSLDIRAISLSRDQIETARRLAADAGLAEIDYAYRDYRDERGRYDRVISVAMFEAVGLAFYPDYFDRIHACLKDDGVALIHTIGRLSGPGQTDSWTDRHIFPGGYAPALSEVLPHIEASGLLLSDVEIWQDHYAETLRAWHQRLVQRRDEVVERFGAERFRMFEFYLCAARTAFTNGDHAIFQIQLVKQRGAVPLSRSYIETDTETLRQRLGDIAATRTPREQIRVPEPAARKAVAHGY